MEKDVALRLSEKGFILKDGDFDFSNRDWFGNAVFQRLIFWIVALLSFCCGFLISSLSCHLMAKSGLFF